MVADTPALVPIWASRSVVDAHSPTMAGTEFKSAVGDASGAAEAAAAATWARSAEANDPASTLGTVACMVCMASTARAFSWSLVLGMALASRRAD